MMNMAIIRMYADMVKDGRRKIEDVPEKYRAEVQAFLNKEAAGK